MVKIQTSRLSCHFSARMFTVDRKATSPFCNYSAIFGIPPRRRLTIPHAFVADSCKYLNNAELEYQLSTNNWWPFSKYGCINVITIFTVLPKLLENACTSEVEPV